MQTIYQIRWEIDGKAQYASFKNKELAENLANYVSNLYKSLGKGELTFEANEISLYEDADDFLGQLIDHL